MRHRLFLTLLLMVAVAAVLLFQGDVVFPHGSYTDALQDIRNAASEQKRHQDSIDEYARLRDLYIGLANDLTGMYSGSLGTTRSIFISALSSAQKSTIANRLDLSVRLMLNYYGSSSLQSMIDHAISYANSYQGCIDYLYNNPTKLPGYASANSAMEAYMDGCTATDHFNDYHSSQQENSPDQPRKKPALGTLPTFECPGTCTNEYNTVWDALSAHHQKCGTAEPVSRLLDFTSQQAILAARGVSDGCGVEWYSCNSDHSTSEAYHRVRTCNKQVKVVSDFDGQTYYHSCGDPFRRCMPHTDYHGSSIFKTSHSETDGSESEDSDDDDSSSPIVSPTPTPTDDTPDCSDCTSHCSSPCGCSTSGTCDGTPSTPSYHACGVHETSVSGDHSYQASCTSTDSNGNTCTVTGFYACDGHSHSYPTPTLVDCWRPLCSDLVSDAYAHQVTCHHCGDSYWTCGTYAYRHTDVATCRRPGCGVSFYKCSNGACSSDWGERDSHWASD